MSSIRLQEIITRAVVGRCDRRVVWTHTAPADGAECVLGVHVSSPQLTVEGGPGGPQVRLVAVCEVWCAAGDETRVERITCTHTEPADVPLVAQVVGETQTAGRLLRGARCLEAEVRDGLFHLTVETHIALEAVGMARLWVKAFDLREDGAEFDSFSSETSDSSLSLEELNADWEPVADLEPEPAAAELGAETETDVGAEAEAAPEPEMGTEAEVDGDAEMEVEPARQLAREEELEEEDEAQTEIAALAGIPDRDSRRRSAAVSRFRGPARVTIVQ